MVSLSTQAHKKLPGLPFAINVLAAGARRGPLDDGFRTLAFPHHAARESVCRGRRCFPRWLPAVRVAGRFWVASREVHAGPVGCGRTLCRHAPPGGVVALGMY